MMRGIASRKSARIAVSGSEIVASPRTSIAAISRGMKMIRKTTWRAMVGPVDRIGEAEPLREALDTAYGQADELADELGDDVAREPDRRGADEARQEGEEVVDEVLERSQCALDPEDVEDDDQDDHHHQVVHQLTDQSGGCARCRRGRDRFATARLWPRHPDGTSPAMSLATK